MKTITIGEKVIDLDIGDELKVKDLRKIQPILKQLQEWGNEIDLTIEIVKQFAVNKEIEATIDDMNIEEFTKLTEEVTRIIDVTQKKNK